MYVKDKPVLLFFIVRETNLAGSQINLNPRGKGCYIARYVYYNLYLIKHKCVVQYSAKLGQFGLQIKLRVHKLFSRSVGCCKGLENVISKNS